MKSEESEKGRIEYINACRSKGDEWMIHRANGRFVWPVVALVCGFLACSWIAPGRVDASGLSDALVRVELFKGLTDAEKEALKAAATLRHGKAGERIIHQGKTLDRMFIILEGRAEVRVHGKHIVTLSGQTLVGEIEFLDMLPASADVLLLQETDLIELKYGALVDLIEVLEYLIRYPGQRGGRAQYSFSTEFLC